MGNTQIQFESRGLDHKETSSVPASMNKKEIYKFLQNIENKIKDKGTVLYYSLASYNNHKEIKEILY